MYSLTKENRAKINPLLTIFEVLLIDWWLNPIFYVMYVPTGFTLREHYSDSMAMYLEKKGLRVRELTNKAISTYGASMLKEAEGKVLTKTPLRFFVIGFAMYWFVPSFNFIESVDMGGLVLLSYLFMLGSVYFYLKARWSVYKMFRLLND